MPKIIYFNMDAVKPVLSSNSKRRPNLVFQTDYRLIQVKSIAHSAILSTFIKLPSAIKSFVLSIFVWPLKTGFTVLQRQTMQCHFSLLAHIWDAYANVLMLNWEL